MRGEIYSAPEGSGLKVVKTLRFRIEPLKGESFKEFEEVLADYKMRLLYWYRKLNYRILKKADRKAIEALF